MMNNSMIKIKSLIASLSLVAGTITLSIPLTAQTPVSPVKSIFLPYQWIDNENVILVKSNVYKREYSKFNIKNNSAESYIPEVVTNEEVSVIDGDIVLTKGKDIKIKLTATPEAEYNPALSPDKAKVAFTRGNNLYSIDIASGMETQLTFDGTNLILNGRASWVYYEEIFGRATNYSAFWWSPDSRTILFYRFDDSVVPLYPIMNFSGQHGSYTETRYPKAGDPNPLVKAGIVDSNGGTVVWIQTDPKEDHYLGTPYWKPDGSGFLLQWMNRDQNTLILYDVEAKNPVLKPIYTEKQNTWVEWIEQIEFGSQGFYMVRDVDSWENIWYQSFDGKILKKITQGNHWGTKIVALDENKGQIWFTSRGKESVRNDLFRSIWKKDFANTSTTIMSTGNYNYRSVLLSPDRKNYLAVVSNLLEPDKLALVNTNSKGVTFEVLEDSRNSEFDWSKVVLPKLVYITTADGLRLPGTMTLPLNFDSTKRYPVIFNIYGGPNSSNVTDIWRAPSQLSQFWAKEGVIQVNVDNRASGHCGKEGENYIYGKLGKYELADFIEWAKYFGSLPYVDSSKIGITGFSYGGTMTALALTEGSDYFSYGIAGGGVYDWKLYDSHYTERFMGTPQKNPQGYKESAVINKVNLYKPENGKLLKLTHGTSDDNVHMQNTIQLVEALINENKHFELMLYPGGFHGYRGKQATHSSAEDIAFWKRAFFGN